MPTRQWNYDCNSDPSKRTLNYVVEFLGKSPHSALISHTACRWLRSMASCPSRLITFAMESREFELVQQFRSVSETSPMWCKIWKYCNQKPYKRTHTCCGGEHIGPIVSQRSMTDKPCEAKPEADQEEVEKQLPREWYGRSTWQVLKELTGKKDE